jgi:hypothetical protein
MAHELGHMLGMLHDFTETNPGADAIKLFFFVTYESD